MPELPDLQVFSKNLHRELAGKKLQKMVVNGQSKLNVPANKLKQLFEKQQLKSVYREGKELRMLFSNKNILGLHMMLHGKLHWYEDEMPKHTLLAMEFDKGKKLALTDFQKKARATVNPEASDAPDALAPDASLSFWKKALKKVLRNAEKQVAKAAPGIIGGEIRDFLLIHNAKKKKSPTGATIKMSTTGGRKTYYTDEQELFE